MKPVFPRRRFIAAVCAAAAAAAFPLAAASRAMARVLGMKQHMLGRMAAPYREDAASERRFPQQNSQLCQMSGLYPGMPENAEELFLAHCAHPERIRDRALPSSAGSPTRTRKNRHAARLS